MSAGGIQASDKLFVKRFIGSPEAFWRIYDFFTL
jgi:hypothetical protein